MVKVQSNAKKMIQRSVCVLLETDLKIQKRWITVWPSEISVWRWR